MKPSDALRGKESLVRELVHRYGIENPRIYGSVAKGCDTENSDLDILVDVKPGTGLLKLGGLLMDLKDLLGVDVDLKTLGFFPEEIREEILNSSKAL